MLYQSMKSEAPIEVVVYETKLMGTNYELDEFE
jgi:hypothetical protein